MILRVDLSGGIARVRISGLAVHSDFETAFSQMIAHPDFKAGMNSLWDARGVDFSQFSTAELAHFNEFVDEHSDVRGRAKGALLVDPAEDSGRSQMFAAIEAMTLPIRLNIFYDLEAAEAWLAVEDDQERPRDEPGGKS